MWWTQAENDGRKCDGKRIKAKERKGRENDRKQEIHLGEIYLQWFLTQEPYDMHKQQQWLHYQMCKDSTGLPGLVRGPHNWETWQHVQEMKQGGSDNKQHAHTAPLIEQESNVRWHTTLCACACACWRVCVFVCVCVCVRALFHCSLVTHLAMVLRALTAVNRVISFFRRSRKMGRHVGSSGLSSGPKWLKICPLEHKNCIIQQCTINHLTCITPY